MVSNGCMIKIMENYNQSSSKSAKLDLFYKQQERLQNITIDRDVSADDLIKNILEKVDTDAKITKFYNGQTRNGQKVPIVNNHNEASAYSSNLLPIPRCFLNNQNIPSIYIKIWNTVKVDDSSDLCNRDKLYQVLLLSNLQSNVLAKLWTFVNRSIPGQLTRNELFIKLALIGLIQKNVSDPINEIYKISYIPVPEFLYFDEHENVNFEKPDAASKITDNFFNLIIEEEFSDFKSAESVQPPLDIAQPSNFNREYIKDNSQNCLINTHQSTININDNEYNSLKLVNIDFPSNTPSNSESFSINLSTFSNDSDLNCNIVNNNHDKYSSLRKLSSTPENTEEFGDFYCHSTDIKDCDIKSGEKSDPTNVHSSSKDTFVELNQHQHQKSNQQKLLNACKQVIHKTFNVLIVEHGEESVLEVIRSKDGSNFASDLHEVFKMSKRIKENLNLLNNYNEICTCNALFEEIQKQWNFIYNIFKKSLINFCDDDEIQSQYITDVDNLESEKCVICSIPCPESTSLLFGGFRYHICCANFWLHFVNSSLPHKNFEADI